MGARMLRRRSQNTPGWQRKRVSKGRRPGNYQCPWSDAYGSPVGDTHAGGTWGAYIEGLPKRTGLTMKDLASKSGIARGTFYKWIAGQTGVTVDSVKKVADAAGDDIDAALRAAGGKLIPEENDPQLREILEADLPDGVKRELVEYVLEQRQQATDAITKQVGVMIRAHKAA
jgi:transcriptional regulator with XRE-family HTH domain